MPPALRLRQPCRPGRAAPQIRVARKDGLARSQGATPCRDSERAIAPDQGSSSNRAARRAMSARDRASSTACSGPSAADAIQPSTESGCPPRQAAPTTGLRPDVQHLARHVPRAGARQPAGRCGLIVRCSNGWQQIPAHRLQPGRHQRRQIATGGSSHAVAVVVTTDHDVRHAPLGHRVLEQRETAHVGAAAHSARLPCSSTSSASGAQGIARWRRLHTADPAAAAAVARRQRTAVRPATRAALVALSRRRPRRAPGLRAIDAATHSVIDEICSGTPVSRIPHSSKQAWPTSDDHQEPRTSGASGAALDVLHKPRACAWSASRKTRRRACVTSRHASASPSACVQRIVAELEEAGYLSRERVGRCNRYKVHTALPLRSFDRAALLVSHSSR